MSTLEEFLRRCRDHPAGRADLIGALAGPDPEQVAGPLPAGWPRPELLSVVGDAIQPATRRNSGAFYTPPPIARAITDRTLGLLDGDPATWTIHDPACGGGAFLIAAVRHLIDRGVAPSRAVGHVSGSDTDSVAVATTRVALGLLAPGADPDLRVGDALAHDDGRRFTAVLGNPPFLNQLERRTARDPDQARRLRDRFGPLVAGYTDSAALFLALAADLTADGGAFGMILPESVMATRDAAAVRELITSRHELVWLWRSVDQVFAANVRVCAPVVRRRAPTGRPVGRAVGAGLRELAARPLPMGTWSTLFADVTGLPPLAISATATLAGFATATADFRDQFYGLAPLAREASGAPTERRLLTVGLIDPAHCLWGERPTRFAGTRFDRPVVDLADLRESLKAWAARRLVPKVLLSTQSRVLEAITDPDGTLLPSTPVITVVPTAVSPAHLAAALSSPVLTAWAVTHFAGSALGADAIKLSARQVLSLPAPTPGPDWDAAAAAFARAERASDGSAWRTALTEVAERTCSAYAVDRPDELIVWWQSRLPRWDRAISRGTGPAARGRSATRLDPTPARQSSRSA